MSQARVSTGDLEPMQEESSAPRRLWSGRSFASATDLQLLESPFMVAQASPPGTAPCTPRVKRMVLQSSPPSIERCPGGFGLDGNGKEDENDGRFSHEFSEVEKIGEGHFSVVFQARNKVDRCMYAVKRTKQISTGHQMRQVQEAFVLASMALEAEGCPNIVRYFSSWFEGGQLYIQMELCECSMRDHMADLCRYRPESPSYSERQITDVLAQVAGGLDSMHTCGFAHLDIKPDNIMRGRGHGRWKIGDLGLADAAMGSGCDEVCEGDCRYLASEVLQGNLMNLARADVFSLGIVAYELATNPCALPVGGDEWHALRGGDLDTSVLSKLSPTLIELICSLLRPIAEERPSCAEILEHPCIARVSPGSAKSSLVMKDESEEVRKLHKELEELNRTAQENREMADKYREELALLRLRTSSMEVQKVDSKDVPKWEEIVRSYSA